MNHLFERLGVGAGKFLLPADTDYSRWSVIACDQHTAQRDYWEALSAHVNGAPSALSLILPEAYLAESEQRTRDINANMETYLADGIFRETENGMVYVERTTQSGTRRGLVLLVDLECYAPDGTGLIRPTEETVPSRVPPRAAIRKNAALELSHVMLLCNDWDNEIFDAAKRLTETAAPLYDFDLFRDGGHLVGKQVAGSAMETLTDAFTAAEKKAREKDARAPFIVVGDGNHSLAAARMHWMMLKEQGAPMDHPARFAMAELVNIHDPAILFAPIHRVLFHVEQAALEKALLAHADGLTVSDAPEAGKVAVPMVTKDGTRYLNYANPAEKWAVHLLQQDLDAALPDLPDAEIDYIHGDDTLKDLAAQDGAVGFLLPPTDKNTFFRVIGTSGVLPRKTFSIGQANEKRFYTEARCIR